MAEVAQPYTLGQEESATPQYEDAEKSSSSVKGEKAYDGGYWK